MRLPGRPPARTTSLGSCAHPLLLDQSEQGLVEGPHAMVLALGYGLLELAGLGGIHDEVPHTRGGHHRLAGRRAPDNASDPPQKGWKDPSMDGTVRVPRVI
jgi:hypothetical protein